MNFVFDIDGTLCFDGKTIDPAITHALNTLKESGHTVIFASARPIRDLVPVLPPQFREGKLIGGNGCFAFDHGVTHIEYLAPTIIEQLNNMVTTYELTYLADSEWDFSYNGSIHHPIYQNINQSTAHNRLLTELEKICKFVIFDPTEEIISQLEQLPVSLINYKNENAIDISPLGINKRAGLTKLQIHDFIAFGNDYNDQCLFEGAQLSVCVGENEVHQYASMKISQDEVAQTILELNQRFITV